MELDAATQTAHRDELLGEYLRLLANGGGTSPQPEARTCAVCGHRSRFLFDADGWAWCPHCGRYA